MKEFEIVAKDIAKTTAIAADKAYTGKANAWKSEIVLTDSDGKKLGAGIDYGKEAVYTYEKVVDGYHRSPGDIVMKEDAPPAGTEIRAAVSTGGAKMHNYRGETYAIYRIVGGDIAKSRRPTSSTIRQRNTTTCSSPSADWA